MNTEKVKTTIEQLKTKLTLERQIYAKHKKTLANYYPKEWDIVDKAIQTIALYLHGEMARYKASVVAYMNGHTMERGFGAYSVVADLHTDIDELLDLIIEAEGSAQTHREGVYINVEMYDLDRSLLDSKLQQIKMATKMVERKTYDGQ